MVKDNLDKNEDRMGDMIIEYWLHNFKTIMNNAVSQYVCS